MQIQTAWPQIYHFLIFGVETPDCSGEDGIEGAVPLHPSAYVLGSL